MLDKIKIPDQRWLSLFACLMIEAVSGSSYAFSLYSNQLKANLGYDQSSIETVGSLGNIGLYLSIVAGLCFDGLGPTLTGLIGATLCCVGYALTWLASKGQIATPVGLVSLYCFLWSHGSAWLDTVAVSTTIKNFRANKATVLGLAKALFGLSASMLTIIYTNLFKPDVDSFLLFLTAIIPAVAVPAALLTSLSSPGDAGKAITRRESYKLLGGFALLAGLMAYCCSVGLASAKGAIGAIPGLAYALIPLLLGQALLTLRYAAAETVESKKEEVRAALLAGDGNLEHAIDAVEKGATAAGSAHDLTNDKSGATFIEGALSLELPLIMVALFAGTGSGLVTINNLGQITKALGADADGADVYVMLLSIANCLGRMIIGAISDGTARYISRPVWLAFAVASMGGSQLLSAYADLNSLYFAVVWTGASYGMFWSLGPPLISDRFGQGNIASIYSLTSLSTGLASYLLSAIMASALYQAHTPAGSTTCLGHACYQTTFFALAAMCGVGALSASYVAWRLRGLYGPDGLAIPYSEFEQTEAGQASALARWTQKALMPICCCRCGRRLLVSEDEEYSTTVGVAGLLGQGKGGKGAANANQVEIALRMREAAAEWK